MQRTTWFSGDVAPVREGVYEREQNGFIVFAKWTKQGWWFSSTSPFFAQNERYISAYKNLPWRGLVKPT